MKEKPRHPASLSPPLSHLIQPPLLSAGRAALAAAARLTTPTPTDARRPRARSEAPARRFGSSAVAEPPPLSPAPTGTTRWLSGGGGRGIYTALGIEARIYPRVVRSEDGITKCNVDSMMSTALIMTSFRIFRYHEICWCHQHIEKTNVFCNIPMSAINNLRKCIQNDE